MLSSRSLSAAAFGATVGPEDSSLRRKITVVISRSTVISILRTIVRLSAGSCSPAAFAFRLSSAGSSIGLRRSGPTMARKHRRRPQNLINAL
jgi:hypothetical protein